jgi:hypothetical protein
MAQSLHPSGFVETGPSCTGPRYIRSQPNRESPGVLLDSVTDKYVAEFDLPYRNITRYVKEIENNWPKLDPRQKEIVANSLNMFSLVDGTKDTDRKISTQESEIKELSEKLKDTEKMVEGFSATSAPTSISDVSDMVGILSVDPVVRVAELMDQLVNPDLTTMAKVENSVGPAELETTLEYLKKAVGTWCYGNSYYQGSPSFFGIAFLIIAIFLLMGVGVGYNC